MAYALETPERFGLESRDVGYLVVDIGECAARGGHPDRGHRVVEGQNLLDSGRDGRGIPTGPASKVSYHILGCQAQFRKERRHDMSDPLFVRLQRFLPPTLTRLDAHFPH